METTKKVLVLTFGTPAGKQVSITVSKPKDDLTAENIKTAMTTILDAEIMGADALVTTMDEAKFVLQQVQKVNLGA